MVKEICLYFKTKTISKVKAVCQNHFATSKLSDTLEEIAQQNLKKSFCRAYNDHDKLLMFFLEVHRLKVQVLLPFMSTAQCSQMVGSAELPGNSLQPH